MRPARRLFLPLLWLVLVLPAAADPWDDALATYNAGRFDEALALMEPLARAGNVEAQNRLAHMYWYGEGTRIDDAESLRWTLLSAAQGNAIGNYNLGIHYLRGRGLARDLAKAQLYLERSAAAGHADALAGLAGVFAEQQDEARYLQYLQQAAEAGSASAQYLMGWNALQQRGPLPPDEALAWIRRAAEQHHAPAQALLGNLIGMGFFAQSDPVEWAMWTNLAARAGCAGAQRELLLFGERLPPDRAAEVEAAIADFLAAHPPEPHRHSPSPRSC